VLKVLEIWINFLNKKLHGSTNPQKEEEIKHISAETYLDNKLRQIHKKNINKEYNYIFFP
jgi:hypothetical protein